VSTLNVVNNEEHNGAAIVLPDREPRKFLPSQQQILALLSRAVVPEERDEFEKQFREVATARNGEHHPDATCIGNTPLSWISPSLPPGTFQPHVSDPTLPEFPQPQSPTKLDM
jgi:hypothetical protein